MAAVLFGKGLAPLSGNGIPHALARLRGWALTLAGLAYSSAGLLAGRWALLPLVGVGYLAASLVAYGMPRHFAPGLIGVSIPKQRSSNPEDIVFRAQGINGALLKDQQVLVVAKEENAEGEAVLSVLAQAR